MSTVLIASSIALHSYITQTSSSLTIEQNGIFLTVPEHQADLVLSGTDSALATPIATCPTTDEQQPQLISICKNETLLTVFSKIGLDRKGAAQAIAELKKVYNPKALKQGQELSVEYTPGSDSNPRQFKSLNFKTTAGNSIELTCKDGQFQAQKLEIKLIRTLRKVEGNINSSFYSAALKKGVPANIVKDAISALSYEVNWQHDPKSGDEFRILFEVFEDENGNTIKTGDLKYAAFSPQGNLKQIYAFNGSAGSGFYNERGESVVKCLLATPIDSTKMRITSRFGRRTHPVLGYSKMHKGIDFGAPVGTPVSSAGDGVVVKAGWNGSYGNYVLIRHNNQYSTAYAHLSKIHVKAGQRIRQRQNIGSVGTTGRATGPHLHYEVIANGTQVNPMSIKQLPTARLNKKEMASFQQIMLQCSTDMKQATPVTRLASAESTSAAIG